MNEDKKEQLFNRYLVWRDPVEGVKRTAPLRGPDGPPRLSCAYVEAATAEEALRELAKTELRGIPGEVATLRVLNLDQQCQRYRWELKLGVEEIRAEGGAA